MPDANEPWNHTPKIGVLRPRCVLEDGWDVDSLAKGMNPFPEITLLSNDVLSDVEYFKKTFLIRRINEEKIK